MNRTFVIGDIHGASRALQQCLDKASFRYDTDHLICLGDVADGWPDTKAAIDNLLRIKNLTYILGNHDWWTLRWMQNGVIDPLWYAQGGKATIDSYVDGVPETHIELLENAPLYFRLGNSLFVHAGIDPQRPLERHTADTLLWDRLLATRALEMQMSEAQGKLTSFDEVYLGHTPIPFDRPLEVMGVWLMDTGAGWSGVLSMMNVDTKDVFVSDPVPQLYPGVMGRRKNNV